MKLQIDEDAALGSSELVVSNFGDSLGQFLIMFGFLGHFYPREEEKKERKKKKKFAKKILKII